MRNMVSFSREQLAFLEHPPEHSARVLAGPGTGKSFTSVAYLERVSTNNPDLRVGYLTFTRAATAEFARKMNDSGLSALGGKPPKTMHGFALGLLLEFHSGRIPYPLRIPDSWEVKNLIRPDISNRLRAKGFSHATPTCVKALEEELAANFESLGGAALPIAKDQPELTNAYRGVWEAHRKSYGYTLLSELPYQASGVLADLDEIDVGIDLLIVDEYQDLNKADQEVLQRLSDRGIAVIAIGDDDQSIYSWRNAAPDGIRQFKTTFDTNYDYPLSISQRCGGKALEVASSVIEQDSLRPAKKRLTPSDSAPATEFRYLKFKNNVAEAREVARLLAKRIESGVDPSQIVVLVRSRSSIWRRELEPQFKQLDIPMAPLVDVDAILADRGVRKALALGQLAGNIDDSLAWRSLIEVTPGVGKAAVDYVYQSDAPGSFASCLLALHNQGFDGYRGKNTLSTLVNDALQGISLAASPKDFPVEGGWASYLAELVGRDLFDEYVLQLFNAIGDQMGTEAELAYFVREFEPALRDLMSGMAQGVRIMTMGMSKGLTVNTAVVLGVENGNVPKASRARDEELRLLYVALTRATDLTVVCYANRRRGTTARVGDPRVGQQREQSPFMATIRDVTLEDGKTYVAGLGATP